MSSTNQGFVHGTFLSFSEGILRLHDTNDNLFACLQGPLS